LGVEISGNWLLRIWKGNLWDMKGVGNLLIMCTEWQIAWAQIFLGNFDWKARHELCQVCVGVFSPQHHSVVVCQHKSFGELSYAHYKICEVWTHGHCLI
jgi:hypothetical protein